MWQILSISRVISVLVLALSVLLSGSVWALDARSNIERSVAMIERGEFALARSYLAPALIDPRIGSAERSRAYYLRGFSFLSQQMFVSARKDFHRALEFNPANPVVLTDLGRLYADGRGVEPDPALGFALFEQAARQDYPRAQFQLGHAYLHGVGVDKNVVAAREHLSRAAEQGFTFAMLNLAASYRSQFITDPQPDIALKWYERAHQEGEANALLSIAFMHANGEFGQADPASAAGYFRQALDAGVAVAGVHLAYAYLTGDGVPQDENRAFALYETAAKAQVVPGFIGLGHMYEHGLGVEPDRHEALTWYEKAAQRGDEDALMRLVSFHLAADTDESRAKALHWSGIAAEGGTAQAHNTYAWLLATLKTDHLRNGTLALDQAKKAVSAEPSAAFLDTLAAAYAEVGQFERAVQTQREALALIDAGQADLLADFTRRLHHYERAEPWRE